LYYDWGWRAYVPVAQRRRQAALTLLDLRKRGHAVSPIVLQGRTIARTFWGKAWCDNLERYSDFANRLPRGRTYVRNGSVIDLQITAGQIKALVSGSDIYTVAIKVAPVAKVRWKSICKDCAGAIDSLVELLQGRFSKGVMERICRQKTGLFPSPREIELACSCPDWAEMCKHVAAVLYGVGARLDQQPELLFRLNQVDENDLIAKAGDSLPLANKRPAAAKVLGGGENLSELFGLDLQQRTENDNNKLSEILTARRSKAIAVKTATARPGKLLGQPAKKGRLRSTRGSTRSEAAKRRGVSLQPKMSAVMMNREDVPTVSHPSLSDPVLQGLEKRFSLLAVRAK
jgi:uncharacterized Zn finger protein